MRNDKSIELARCARAIYDERYKAKLEATNTDDFVAIESDSGDFFIGKTLSEAIQAAQLRIRSEFRLLSELATRRP